ncbi:MAG: nucleotidyltransferase [Clostridiaceae bacterium]|jgi:predicted nucleotidyltransferase|nr:nucleotidyltransferase [Clostridiaceae bacterium]
MNVLGIVSEYNPLHSGHVYHIAASREKIGATHVVCVMSGNFVQRGEPAVVDKWARAKMALHSGVDLVLELPVVFACASAEIFARGAVRILDKTGIVDYLGFGSEQGEIETLKHIASVLVEEPSEFRLLLKDYLKQGLSFPAAREKAVTGYLNDIPEDIMNKSNNILAIEYLKALIASGSGIKPVTIKRKGSAYQDSIITESFSSATAIRHFLKEAGSVSDPVLNGNLPSQTRSVLGEYFENSRGPVFPEDFADIIIYLIRTIGPAKLKHTPDVNEGLESRLISAAFKAGTLDDLIETSATSRYPSTRIKRILFNTLLGITTTDLKSILADEACGYIRILGFNERGRELLQRMQDTAAIPVITKTAKYRSALTGLSKKMFEYDVRATDVYVLAFNDRSQRGGDQDFTTPIVRI